MQQRNCPKAQLPVHPQAMRAACLKEIQTKRHTETPQDPLPPELGCFPRLENLWFLDLAGQYEARILSVIVMGGLLQAPPFSFKHGLREMRSRNSHALPRRATCPILNCQKWLDISPLSISSPPQLLILKSSYPSFHMAPEGKCEGHGLPNNIPGTLP